MARRSYPEIFRDKLAKLSKTKGSPISNKQLLDSLTNWDEVRYKRVKGQLQDEGQIQVGRGGGGTVRLTDNQVFKGISVFIAYSHADEMLKNELIKHLSPLERIEWIKSWHDQKIKPGEKWEGAISKHLNSADLILLLISADFINSDYCYEIEMEKALDRHDKESAVVVPIILRNCMWRHTPLAEIQALPKEGKAVSSWGNQDDALVDVAIGIRRIVENLRN